MRFLSVTASYALCASVVNKNLGFLTAEALRTLSKELLINNYSELCSLRLGGEFDLYFL